MQSLYQQFDNQTWKLSGKFHVDRSVLYTGLTSSKSKVLISFNP